LKMQNTHDSEGLRNAGLAIIAVSVVLARLVYGRTFSSYRSLSPSWCGTSWRQ
jgi:hypothetical protein